MVFPEMVVTRRAPAPRPPPLNSALMAEVELDDVSGEMRKDSVQSKAGTSSRAPRSGDPLMRFLLDPHSYPTGVKEVKLVQTHASLVFVAGMRVYKIKKPVDFGFLDFTRLEARKADCEREVALNQRLAPGVYEGVVSIVRGKGGLKWGPPRDSAEIIVEYAVVMRRLEEDGFLDRMLAEGRLTRTHLDRVGALLARFYGAQKPRAEVTRWGRESCLKKSTRENFRQAQPFVGKTLTRVGLKFVERFNRRFFTEHAALFRERIREGRILDCHGDLHLEHVHFSRKRGTISIYDCIEFNERFRFVDVASDVAFLGMDLEFRGRHDLARYWTELLARQLKDPGLRVLARFYGCYRAMVRGKVESFLSEAKQASEEERRASGERARRYFQLALRYAVTGVEPCVWVLMGGIGSGKSTVARGLHRELGWLSGSSDVFRKQMAGVPLLERTPKPIRSTLYSADMTRQTYEKLNELADMEVRAGRQVILDATYGTREARARLVGWALRRRVPVRFLELRAPAEQVKARLQNRQRRGGEVSDARLEDWAALKSRYESPSELPEGMVSSVSTGADVETTLSRVLDRMSRWDDAGLS